MSKSALRKEYEAMFGAIEGTLRLYDASGNVIYRQFSNGDSSKYQYDTSGNMIYREFSDGRCFTYQYDTEGNTIYSEDSVNGVTFDKREIEKVERSELTEKLSKITDEQLDDLVLVARLAGREAIRKELQQTIKQMIEQ